MIMYDVKCGMYDVFNTRFSIHHSLFTIYGISDSIS